MLCLIIKARRLLVIINNNLPFLHCLNKNQSFLIDEGPKPHATNSIISIALLAEQMEVD